MTKEEIRDIVHQVLLEERVNQEKMLDAAILKVMVGFLTGFGIEEDERKETKKDITFLRRLRIGFEKSFWRIVTAAISIIIGAIGTVFYLGITALVRASK